MRGKRGTVVAILRNARLLALGLALTLEVESIPQTLRTQGTLTLGAPDAQLYLLWKAWTCGTSELVFSQSADGIEWTEAGSAPVTSFDASNVAVELTAGSYDAFAIPQELVISSISICADPGGL